MKKIITLLLALFASLALAQNPNPQPNFQAQVLAANPSLYLNFNSSTTNFLDRISQQSFVQSLSRSTAPQPPNGNTYSGHFNGTDDYISTASTSALTPAAMSINTWVYIAGYANSYTVVSDAPGDGFQLMVKNNGKLAIYVTNTSGTTINYDGTGTATLSLNTWYFLSVTYDSTSGLKGYVNGTLDNTAAANGSLKAYTASAHIGYNAAFPTRLFTGQISNITYYNTALTSTQVNTLYTGGTIASGLIAQWQLNEGAGSTATDSSSSGLNGTWTGTAGGNFGYYTGPDTYNSGVTTPRQPGFDQDQIDNTSALFPYNGWLAAPTNSLGTMEWSSPWSLMIHVDRLNWDRTGTLVLASKGDISSTSNSWWKLALTPSGKYATLCFTMNGYSVRQANQGVCTGTNVDALPAGGFNYDIVVTYSGTGSGAGLDMYVNGLESGAGFNVIKTSASFQYGFGAVTYTVSGGTGYAASTPFTVSGGGPNCTISGTMNASSGVPSGFTYNYGPDGVTAGDYGCTSVPTLTLTAPTGTGATFTGTLSTPSINSSTAPLMVPGYISSGTPNGISAGDSSQAATAIDEFAIFPSVLTQTQIHSLFYLTKFWQGLVYPHDRRGASAPLVVLDTSSCGGDPSGLYQDAMTYGAQRAGLINLAMVVNNDANPPSTNSFPWFRQTMALYGLNHVPLTIGAGSWNGGSSSGCVPSLVSQINSAFSADYTTYPPAGPMYRKIFASHPNTPIYVMMSQTANAYYDFLQSPADSISPLTGLQLQAQNAANGGFLSIQGGECGQNPAIAVCSHTATFYPPNAPNTIITPTQGQYVLTHNGSMPIYFMEGNPANAGPGGLYTRTSTDPFYVAIANILAQTGAQVRPGWNTQQTAQIISPYFYGGVQVTYSGGTGYANSTPFTSTGGGTYCHVTGIMTASGGVPNGITDDLGVTLTNNYGSLGYGCTSAPTLVLTTPTGSGVTLTALPTIFCFDVTETYNSGPGNWTETYNGATCGNKYAGIPSEYGNSVVYTWFENSLIDPPPNLAPKVP